MNPSKRTQVADSTRRCRPPGRPRLRAVRRSRPHGAGPRPRCRRARRRDHRGRRPDRERQSSAGAVRGRRVALAVGHDGFDLPNRGNILSVPADLHVTEDGRIRGTALFRRFHLGRNGAVHGGCVGAAVRLAAGVHGLQAQSTASPDARRSCTSTTGRSCRSTRSFRSTSGIDRIEDRKIFVAGTAARRRHRAL